MRGAPMTIDDRRTPRSVPPLLGLGLGGATVPTPPGLFLEGLAAINRGRAAGWLKSACGRTGAQGGACWADYATHYRVDDQLCSYIKSYCMLDMDDG